MIGNQKPEFPKPRAFDLNLKLFLAALLTGGTPLIAQLLGFRFMAAPGYLAAVNLPAMLGATMLAFTIARALTRYELANNLSRKPAWQKRLIFIPVALIVFVTTYLSGAVTLPMAVAALAGRDTEVRVVAGNQSSSSRRICGSPVSLSYPHFIFNMLCDVERPVREVVTKGDRLRLDGYGNAAGIYYRTVSLEN